MSGLVQEIARRAYLTCCGVYAKIAETSLTFLRAASCCIAFNDRIVPSETLSTEGFARASYAVRHPLIAEVTSIVFHFEVRRDIVVGIIVRNLDAGLAVVILTSACAKRRTRKA